jgi:hypothetical protein
LPAGGELDQAGANGFDDHGDARTHLAIELIDPSGAERVSRAPEV